MAGLFFVGLILFGMGVTIPELFSVFAFVGMALLFICMVVATARGGASNTTHKTTKKKTVDDALDEWGKKGVKNDAFTIEWREKTK